MFYFLSVNKYMCEIGGFGGWNGGMFYVILNCEEIVGSL